MAVRPGERLMNIEDIGRENATANEATKQRKANSNGRCVDFDNSAIRRTRFLLKQRGLQGTFSTLF